MDKKPTPEIVIIGASAGTGKTTRLKEEFIGFVRGAAGHLPVPAEKIAATTFTNKAANELSERVRQALIDSGNWENAQAVLSGYVGTVNAVFGRIVVEHALETGRSPEAEIIDEDRTRQVFRVAVETIIDEFSELIEDVAGRTGYTDWRKDLLKVTELARANAIKPEALAAMATRSRETFAAMLPAAAPDAAALDAALAFAVQEAVIALSNSAGTTKATNNALSDLKAVAEKIGNSETLPWSDWIKLSNLKAGKSEMPLLALLKEVASQHSCHPRLHSDVSSLIEKLFACAERCMKEYAQYKARHGLIDFVDQEYLALQLLDRADIQMALKERIRVALVDEFQDTSPIQLALFLKLAEIVERSIWVGDEKQAIYGFRGTDPELMQSVVAKLGPTRRAEPLRKSYRARKALVDFANDIFAQVFPPRGIARESVVIEATKTDEPDHETAVRIWWLPGINWDDTLSALAGELSTILSAHTKMLIKDRVTGQMRRPVGSDIAILLTKNDRCAKMAASLAAAGIKAAAEYGSLLQTPEGVLTFAALRYLVDRNDSLAAAELVHLGRSSQASEQKKNAWLSEWLTSGSDAFRQSAPELAALDQARQRLLHLTPQETLQLAIASADVLNTVKSWGNVQQRLGNIDAVMGLANQYEKQCGIERRAATASGLVTFLLQEVEDGGQQPANPDRDAVQVLTYFKAKGLEWPIVILSDLQEPPERDIFNLHVESADGELDPLNPLDGRWIRFWPWPYGYSSYGKRTKDAYLDARALATCEGQRVLQKSSNELVRLMYVGITRARDYVIFAPREKEEDKAGWLSRLVDEKDQAVLKLLKDDAATFLEIAGKSHPVQVKTLALPEEQSKCPIPVPAPSAIIAYMTPPAVAVDYPAYHLTASHNDLGPQQPEDSKPEASQKAIHRLGTRLPLTGTPDMEMLGDAIHGFLAADNYELSPDKRALMAARVLKRWGVVQLSAADLVLASDRLKTFLADLFGQGVMLREYPVCGRIGSQRLSGRIDLLYECERGFVLLDHKSFPGPYSQWEHKAASFAGQMCAYRTLVEQAAGKHVIAAFIHLPVVGSLVEMEIDKQLATSQT